MNQDLMRNETNENESTETEKGEKQLGTRISKKSYDEFMAEWRRRGVSQRTLLEDAISMLTKNAASEKHPGSKTDIETFNSSIAVLNNLYLKSVEAREDFAAVAEEQRLMFLAEAERANADLKAENEGLKKALDEYKKQLTEQQKAVGLAVREKEAALLQRKNGDETIAIQNEKIRSMEKSKELLEATEHKANELQLQLDAVNRQFRDMSMKYSDVAANYFRTADDKDGEIEALKTKVDMLRTQLIKANIKPIVDDVEAEDTEI